MSQSIQQSRRGELRWVPQSLTHLLYLVSLFPSHETGSTLTLLGLALVGLEAVRRRSRAVLNPPSSREMFAIESNLLLKTSWEPGFARTALATKFESQPDSRRSQ